MNRNSRLLIFIGIILILPTAAGAQTDGAVGADPNAQKQKSMTGRGQAAQQPCGGHPGKEHPVQPLLAAGGGDGQERESPAFIFPMAANEALG